MVTRTRPYIRFLTLFLAALQFALPGIASVVDGAAARVGPTSRAHVEDIAQNSCTPPHSPDCVVCQFLSTSLAQVETTATATVLSWVPSKPMAAVAVYSSASRFDFQSRAPPNLLA
jgi:hypothetical protein